MADEKDIKAEELTDEQADEVAGGIGTHQKSYMCVNYPRCRNMVSTRNSRCAKCEAELHGQ